MESCKYEIHSITINTQMINDVNFGKKDTTNVNVTKLLVALELL
jgi:hypothetical protein